MMRILMCSKEMIVVRTTINVDEELIEEARRLTGIEGQSALFKEGLTALVQREAARRLVKLGGTMPDLEVPPRRRPWLKDGE